MSTVLCLFIIVCVFYFTYWIGKEWRFRKLVNAFPGRSEKFLIGDVPFLSNETDKLFLQIRKYSKDFPNGYRFWAGHFGALNLNKAEDVEVLLSSSKHIEKSIVYEFLEPWLERGLLTSGGDKWQHRRKILTPAFHFNILKRFINIFNEHGKIFVKELENECIKSRTNIVPLISKHTLNIICETAMGISLDSNDTNQIEYCEAIHGMGPLIVNRLINPLIFITLIYNRTKSGKLFNKYVKILHDFSSKVIKERERTFNPEEFKNMEDSEDEYKIYSKKRFAMLDLLILAKKNGEIDDIGIREEVDTFMFEGHDTTSMAVCYALLMLANHKEIQNKVRQEIDDILKDTNQMTTYQDLQNMHYLEMFLKEVLRLYPSVPFFSRKVTEELFIRNKKVPVGCLVHVHSYDLHRDPRVFPDPEKFDPERFSPENSKGRHPYAYIPFSAGPRNCIGQRFAMLELKSVLSSILQYYQVDPIDTPSSIVIQADLVLRPKYGIHVKFKPRSPKL